MKEENMLRSGPAFPFDITDEGGNQRWAQGMWLRDYFAAKAIQAIANRTDDEVWLARRAYEMADAMLEAREEIMPKGKAPAKTRTKK